ncbi:5,10-methylenetetrahydrofolate reductase [Desulfocicer vacuolatum DSM 3385]|uniref:Methylenetetrahydrofolate reductase n=1 Tax=Desulfocicer vacuolatum DSM 3385 TaxID=1121400 RepID=A0A1W2CT64_9BACT|nr:methylenetetrahydrofolate reductase [Desulfocicer vacuolatum]SMC88136.1 5,10-methylenetetrahydrofolate reductase [Desulfocicer vacuolatum DSM 3385]
MQFRRRFEAGEFTCLVQIDPPKGTDVSTMVDGAMGVKGIADAFIVPEMANAVMRMSSLGASVVLRNNGVDAVMQVSCRDRNRLALQGDLLAAAACGINAMMVVTGEDPSFGDHHTAKAVYDVDLGTLLKGISSMEKGRDMAGVELSGAPDFLKGATLNTCLRGADREVELDRMKEMVDAGVKFFITQPLFEFSMTQPFFKTADNYGAKIIPTVLLLKSLGMARYMARNVNYVNMPDAIVHRVLKASDKVRECTRMARETIEAVKKEGFAGVNVSTLGWEHKLPEVLGVMDGLKG